MLNFPNRSRVFDPTRRAVQFWGHDSAMEWSFFVSEDALRRLYPVVARDEASLLLAFDNNRAAITQRPQRRLTESARDSTNSQLWIGDYSEFV